MCKTIKERRVTKLKSTAGQKFISNDKQATERINFMCLEEDTDSIYSLALNSKVRLIGIRKGATFQVVWYDANHKFAPSKLKNT